MSHVATITLEFRDPEALAEAAAALGLARARETVRFYDGTLVTGPRCACRAGSTRS